MKLLIKDAVLDGAVASLGIDDGVITAVIRTAPGGRGSPSRGRERTPATCTASLPGGSVRTG